MPKCGVVGCNNSQKKDNQKSLSMHRLPTNEVKRKQWLKAIGTENIRPNVKDIYICSSHFHEDAFNKTLDVIRLRDDATPLQFPGKPSTGQDGSELLTETNCRKENILSQTPSTDPLNSLSLLPVESEVGITATNPEVGSSQGQPEGGADGAAAPGAGCQWAPSAGYQGVPNRPCRKNSNKRAPKDHLAPPGSRARAGAASSVQKLMQSEYVIIATDPVSGTSDVRKLMIPVKSIKSTTSTIPTQLVADTSGTLLTKEQTRIKDLEQKCAILRRKVKALNETVRRQKKKIYEYQNITKDSIVVIVPQESQDAPQIPVKIPVKKLHKILRRNKFKEQ